MAEKKAYPLRISSEVLDALQRWAERCERLLAVHVFPGGHFYFHDDPDALADAVVLGVATALRMPSAPLAGR